MTRVWVDIDNPPQAQYLTPVARALRAAGAHVSVTARRHEPTLRIVEHRGESALPVCGEFGTTTVGKARGTVERTLRLARLHARCRPDVVLATSRSGVLAARLLDRPCFTVLDYEGVEMRSFRWSGTTILHPAVVPSERFASRGFPARRLRAFPGMKEDLTFAGLSPEAEKPAVLPAPWRPMLPSILVRPPSETSHYRVDASVQILGALMDRLARRNDVQVVLTLRSPSQRSQLEGRDWHVPPVVLEQPMPFVPLLRVVDWVVTGGGTMLREAAWMGVPGVTVFQGDPPAVDLWLEQQGAIRRIVGASDLDAVPWATPSAVPKIPRHDEAMSNVVSTILAAARR